MKRKTIFFGIIISVLSGCTVLQALHLASCNYSYSHISDVTFMDVTSSQMLSVAGAARVTQGLLGRSETIPMGLVLHLNVQNPNPQSAAIDSLYYTVYFDSVFIGDGHSLQPIAVPPTATIDLPVHVSMDLKTLLSGDKRQVVGHAVKNIIGMGSDSTRVTVGLKPTLRFGQVPVTLRSPIPVSFTIRAKDRTR